MIDKTDRDGFEIFTANMNEFCALKSTNFEKI
jgi:hypothetical protein